ncbi:hypothetical protein [Nocardioides sp. BYT-33-1]|uniref:hypothetical protein n=1 Tax=Nocardioides sp. BYT-33-1 TaxID=3416952 RepID=UPI003F537F61
MTDATELDIDAIRARVEAATELWSWHEDTDDTLAGWGAHMGQMLYRLPRDGQTDDMRESILAMVADLGAALDEVERIRVALDEAQAEAAGHRKQTDHHIGRANRAEQQVGHLTTVVRGLEASLDEATTEVETRRDQLTKFVDAHAVWVERNEAATARAEAAEAALGAVRSDEAVARVAEAIRRADGHMTEGEARSCARAALRAVLSAPTSPERSEP